MNISEYHFSIIKPEHYYLLKEFTYQAIFQKPNQPKISKNILCEPELKVFYEDFGRNEDYGIAAWHCNLIIGMAWARIFPANVYGSIDKGTPVLAISVLPNYRANGVGTPLIYSLLGLIKNKGYKQISLSVQKENYAAKWYEKIGFKIVKELNTEYLMIYNLNKFKK